MTRILVVDDVRLFRHMESTVLGWRGYTIEEASSGAEALDKIRSNPPDLVLLDFFMPGMSGTEVCSQIKSDPALQCLPVIMVTSSSRDGDIRQAVQAGCDDFLTKPLDDASLIRKVENLLGSATKRRFPRVPASMQISFEDFKGIFFEYSRDISRSGVFIEMDDPLPVGTRLRLSFSLPAPFDHPVLAYGRVVRSAKDDDERSGGVGVVFIHVDEASSRVIDTLVAGQLRPEEGAAEVFSQLSVQLDEPQAGNHQQPDPRVASSHADYLELRHDMEGMQRDHLRLAAMIAISEGLLSASTPQQVVEAGAEVLSNLLGAASYGIFLFDPGPGLLVTISSQGLPARLQTCMPLDGPILQALQEGKVLKPIPAWPLDEEGIVVLAAGGLRSGLSGPSLGVMTIHELFSQKSELTPADLQLIEMLGRHLSRTLVNAVARHNAGHIGVRTILEALG